MTFTTESGHTVGLYVPSYKRWNKLHEKKLLDNMYVTYVVRESEKQHYEGENVNCIAVEDSKINSLGKVRQWIIDNAKEDVVIQIDDDVKKLCYCLKENYIVIEDSETIINELVRISQILIDLKLGMASLTMTADVRKHISEFLWKGIIGGINWYNRSAVKGKYEGELIKVDTDFVLQELLHNRIIIVPDYMGMVSEHDRNAGGNNTSKTYERLVNDNNYLKLKWGKNYDFDYKKNQSKVVVKR